MYLSYLLHVRDMQSTFIDEILAHSYTHTLAWWSVAKQLSNDSP